MLGGSVLALLFIIYFNDVFQLPELRPTMFSVDTTVYAVSLSAEMATVWLWDQYLIHRGQNTAVVSQDAESFLTDCT